MKKIALYTFAVVGIVSTLFFFYSSLFSISGSTMYGSASGSIGDTAGPAGTPFAEQAIAYGNNPPPAAFNKMASPPSAPLDNPTQPLMKRMIIRNANLTIEVANIRTALDKIGVLANKSGGYVINSNLMQNDQIGINSSAQISIRIPAEGLNNILTQLKSLSIAIKKEEISGEDITQKYVDLESTLKNLETAKIQLQKIMDNAKKTEDVLSVFRQLTDIQGQIDIIQGQIKYFKESVAYSLVTIELEMKPANAVEQVRSWELVKVAKDAYQALLNQLEFLTYTIIRFIVFLGPLLLIWLTIFLIIFYVAKKLYRHFNK